MEGPLAAPETWLVAHDLSPVSDVALDEAARLVEPLGARLALIHVTPQVHLRPEEAWGQVTFEVTELLRTRLVDVALELRCRRPTVEVHAMVVISNDPARAVIAEAGRIGAAHIVVGTHGRRGLDHLVLGSISEKVAREATVPVTIVRRGGSGRGSAS